MLKLANSEEATEYYNNGNIFYDIGKYEEAIECYDKAIELNPDDAKAYNNKGVSLSKLGRHVEALEAYDNIDSIDRIFIPTLEGKRQHLAKTKMYKVTSS